MQGPQRTAVVAVGGNAVLLGGGGSATIAEQFEAARRFAVQIRDVVSAGWRVVVTHGNAPQVGFILQRSDLVSRLDPQLPRLTLDTCVAESQGSLGYILASTLQSELRAAGLPQRVVALLTHTAVHPDDPAFTSPTKAIGREYDERVARRFAKENGWAMVDDANGGWRRLVPSPQPIRIVEQRAIASLIEGGFVVIALGGGGIPVVDQVDGSYRGVEAVIDKDLASAMLAAEMGADVLCLTTGVERVALNFRRPDQRLLDSVDVDETRRHLADGQFPAGTMGAKLEAALNFLEAGNGDVIITSPYRLADAMNGRTGTRVVSAR